MEFLIEKTSSLALIGNPFNMKWNLFKMFLGSHQTKNHQSGKVYLSVMKTNIILLQNNITHPIPHHLDSSHQSPNSQLCALWKGGCQVCYAHFSNLEI